MNIRNHTQMNIYKQVSNTSTEESTDNKKRKEGRKPSRDESDNEDNKRETFNS